MNADIPRGACLQCEQTREEVRINRTICGSDFTPTVDIDQVHLVKKGVK